MTDRPDKLVRRLKERGDATTLFFREMTSAQLQQQVYTTGPKWRVVHLIAHFVVAEREFLRYGEDILAGGEGAPEDFDIDAFNLSSVSALMDETDGDRAALLDMFAQARADIVAYATRLADSDLDREGRHPFFGFMSLERLLKFLYRHNQIHERDIRKALKTAAPLPHVEITPPAQADAG